jgi:ketosteroid isomerase-like protein
MSSSAISSAQVSASPQESSSQAASSIQVIETPITGGEVVADESEPVAALVQFYRAFNSRDLGLAAESWHHAEDVAMDNPLGGIMRGWPAVRAVYERVFRGPARVEVEFHDYTLHRAGDVFYAVGRERGTCATGGCRLNLAIRTTRVFRRFDGIWRQVHHHGSIDDPQLLGAYRQAVRQS